jgi:hypothetical protein
VKGFTIAIYTMPSLKPVEKGKRSFPPFCRVLSDTVEKLRMNGTGKPALGEQPPPNVDTLAGEKGFHTKQTLVTPLRPLTGWTETVPISNQISTSSPVPEWKFASRRERREKREKRRKEKLFYSNELV